MPQSKLKCLLEDLEKKIFLKHNFNELLQDKQLVLIGKKLDDSDMSDIIAFLNQNQRIKSVDLSFNNISAQGAKEFAEKNTTVIQVDLSHNKIGAQGAKYFAEKNIIATRVSLSYNDICNQGAKDFAWKNTIATQVDLSYNSIGNQGAKDFAQKNIIATHVNLSHNYIGNQGAEDFAEHNTTATHVDLGKNMIDNQGAGHLIKNKIITKLEISGNSINRGMLKIIQQHIESNKTRYQEWMKAAVMIASVRANRESDIKYGILDLIPEILEYTGENKKSARIEKKKSNSGKVHEGFTNTLFFRRAIKFNEPGIPNGKLALSQNTLFTHSHKKKETTAVSTSLSLTNTHTNNQTQQVTLTAMRENTTHNKTLNLKRKHDDIITVTTRSTTPSKKPHLEEKLPQMQL